MKEIPWKKFFVFEDKIYAHPVMIQRLINEMTIKEVEI